MVPSLFRVPSFAAAPAASCVGTRRFEIERLYAKVKYMGTIKKKHKLIFRLRKLDTWGVEWTGVEENMWPQIYWNTKFGKHVD